MDGRRGRRRFLFVLFSRIQPSYEADSVLRRVHEREWLRFRQILGRFLVPGLHGKQVREYAVLAQLKDVLAGQVMEPFCAGVPGFRVDDDVKTNLAFFAPFLQLDKLLGIVQCSIIASRACLPVVVVWTVHFHKSDLLARLRQSVVQCVEDL